MPEQLKPPKWYSADEIYEWFNRYAPIRISNKFSKRDAEWLAGEFQKAFNKGFDMAISQCTEAWNQRSAPKHWMCCGVLRSVEQRCSCGEGADD